MSFLTNNGLLWLILSFALALAILLLIYLIRPNYQQKYVSSTFVWQLSLRYRKKKIPINMLRNILIIICQVLILASCAFIIARPAIALLEDYTVSETVIVMDASASMRTENEDGTRIERAVSEAEEYGREILEDGGIVSVIVCGDDAEIVLERRSGEDALLAFDEAMQDVLENGCTYASTDVNAALQICEDRILNVNPDATIVIYTDETYTYIPEGIEVVNVADYGGEWNAAILDAYTEKVDGYYILYVEFETYGQSAALNFEISFKNPKFQGDMILTDVVGSDEYFILDEEVICEEGEVMTYVFMFDETYDTTYAPLIGAQDNYFVSVSADYTIYSYEEIEIRLLDSTEDSYDVDNVYYVYGGQAQVIDILYTTVARESNKFLPAVLSSVQSVYSDTYDIIIQYSYATADTIDNSEFNSGYDFYIYEHIAPSILPTDGIVFLIDPDQAPAGSGFTISRDYEDITYECYLSMTEEGERSALMDNVTAENIYLTKASLLTVTDPGYEIYMDFEAGGGRYPALMVKDEGDSKVIVMPFSVNYSNFAMLVDFPVFFSNIFGYFYPSTVTGRDFVVGDTITVNTNGELFEIWREYETELLFAEAVEGESYYLVDYPDEYADAEIEMPISFVATEPGRYLLRTQSYFKDAESQNKLNDVTVFVHADLSESDIFAYGTALSSPYKEKSLTELYDELVLWFAVALVALIFIEWILHMLEGI